MALSRRNFWILVGVAVIAVAAAAYFGRDKVAAGGSEYTIAPVVRGDIVQAVSSTGQLTPLVSVEVSTQISGLVTEVNVDFNSKVRKGQILAKIDPATYEQRLRQAEADLAATKASHTLAKLNAERLKGLREEDLVTQSEYDQAKAQLEQSQAGLLTREAAIENAKLDLERCTLTSPIDGVVIFKQIEVGKTVQASFSAPTLFVIAQDLTKMRIIAPVSEVDVGSVHPGQAVTFTVDAIPGRTFHGTLTQIRNPYTSTDKAQQGAPQQSTLANFDAVIDVDNADMLLRPSVTANVSIVVQERKGVLTIPNGALRVEPPANALPVAGAAPGKPAPPGPRVYRLPGGQRDAVPETVSVKLGITNSIFTEVLEGLNEGDTVITGKVAERPDRRGFALGF